MAHIPDPNEAHGVAFFIKWYQEFIGGLILGLITIYFKSKGKAGERAIVPMSEEEIEHRMTICRQSIFLDMHKILDERDRRLEDKLSQHETQILEKIEKLHIRLNKRRNP